MLRLFFLTIFLLSGCATTNQEKIGEVLQSHGATNLHYDYKKTPCIFIRNKIHQNLVYN